MLLGVTGHCTKLNMLPPNFCAGHHLMVLHSLIAWDTFFVYMPVFIVGTSKVLKEI